MSPGEENLYCPACGYNLRGLAGDPVRCPECGGAHDRKSLDVSDQDVRNHVQYMSSVVEDAARNTATYFYYALIFGIWALSAGWSAPLAWLCAVVAAVSLPFNLVRIRGLCRARRGWLSGFVLVHMFVYAIFLMLCLISIIAFLILALARARGVAGIALPVLLVLIVLPRLATPLLKSRFLQAMRERIFGAVVPFRPAVAKELLRLERRDERLRKTRRVSGERA